MSNLSPSEPWKLVTDAVTGTARTLVSRDKYRLKDRQLGVDLDLTYITERIIAMGLPAEGRKINVLYRNREDDVAKFLNARHPGHYMIFNLSEKHYSYGKFFGAVQEFGWPDHHAPPLAVLIDAVQAMDDWLARSPANVIAVHCKAGRGRTGTVVVSLLHYLGLCDSIPRALHWFADRRSRTGEGVSLPSQVRYCHYFAETMRSGIPARKRIVLVGVEFQPVPGMGVEGRFCPAIELSKAYTPKKPFFSNVGTEMRYGEGDYSAMVRCNQSLQGDVCVRVSHQSVLPGTPPLLLLRAQFNTAFVSLPTYQLRYSEIDGPASAPLSDSRFVSHFTVTFHFAEGSPFEQIPSPTRETTSSPAYSSALSEMKTPYVHNGRATPPLPSSHATFPSASSPISASPPLPPRTRADVNASPSSLDSLQTPSQTALMNHGFPAGPASTASVPSHSEQLMPAKTIVVSSLAVGAGEANHQRHLEKRHYQHDSSRLLDSPPPIDRSIKGRSLPPGTSPLRISPQPSAPQLPSRSAKGSSPSTHGPAPHRSTSDLAQRHYHTHNPSPSPSHPYQPSPPATVSHVPRAASTQFSSSYSATARHSQPMAPPQPPRSQDDFAERMKNLLGPS